MLDQSRHYLETAQHRLKQVYTEFTQREPFLSQLRRQLAMPDVRIWCCFIGSTLVWATYFVSVYALPSIACHWQWTTDTGSGLKLLQVLISVIAAGAIAGTGYVVFTGWQQAREAGYTEFGQAGAAHLPLLAFVTLLLHTFYLLIIIPG